MNKYLARSRRFLTLIARLMKSAEAISRLRREAVATLMVLKL
ncbi:MAG: hypothetical protein ACUVUQ_02470 [Thermodesulfovibrionales bacterium]